MNDNVNHPAHYTQGGIECIDCIKQARSPVDVAIDTAIDALRHPTIEAEPVRHGRWIECNYRTLENGYIESYKATLCCYCCSECLTGFKKNHMTYKEFCPACGAKMDATDTNVGGKGGADNG